MNTSSLQAPIASLPRRPAGLLACWPACLLLLALLWAGPPAARAAFTPPDSLTYQGYLVDGNGNPLAPTTPQNYPVIFRVFTAATGGQRLWSEQQIVTVDKGNFSVVLGEGTPVGAEERPPLSSVFSGPSASDRYISTSVTIGGSTPEILPRLRMMTSPYSFLATRAANLVQPNGSNVITYANSRVEVSGNLVTTTSGRIGIGTVANPVASLEVASGGVAVTGASSPYGGRGLYLEGLNTYGSLFAYNYNTAQPMPLVLNSPGGNVGIGTATPNAQMSFGGGLANTKLALWDGGPGAMYGFGVQPSQFRFHVNNPSDRFSFLNGVAGTEVMTIQGGGNVGIGTAPGARLDVLSSTGSRLRVFNFSGGAGSQLVGGWAANSPLGPQVRYERVGAAGFWDLGMVNADYVIEESDTPRLTLRAGGNVGIGTATPTSLLQLGSVGTTGDAFLRIESIGGNQFANGIKLRNFNDEHGFDLINEERNGTGLQANGFHIIRHEASAAGATAFFIGKFGGNIGLHTTAPADRLHLRGGAFRLDDGANEYIQMFRSPNGLILSGNGMGNPAFPNGVGQIQWDGDNNWDNFSDRRLKTDITDAEPVLDRLMHLPVRRYRWKEAGEDATKKFGVIAQEVQPLFPDSVGQMTQKDTNEDYLTVKYGTFGLLAVKALQELKAEKDSERAAFRQEISDLKKEIERLNGKVAAARVDVLEQQLDDLKQVVQRLVSERKGTTAAALGSDR